MEDKNLQFNKWISSFKKDSKIKSCFHPDKQSCSNKIVSAHSLQKNGVLSIIEDEVNGNLSVYSFLNQKLDEDGNPIGFEPLGKNNASTFFGFCGYHDTILFQEIENNPIDLDSPKHCFLLSYRAFAKDTHSKMETLQGYKTNALYAEPDAKFIKDGLVEGSELGVRDFQFTKQRMDQILIDENYDELEYFSYTVDYIVPIAVSGSFNPDYSYSNKLLNKSDSPSVVYEFVNFTVVPTETGQTHILFSCLPEHKKSVEYIEELSQLSDKKLEKAISSIIIGYFENTFISPKIWEKLTSKEKKQLLKELVITNPMLRSHHHHFFHSRINFFEKRFVKKLRRKPQ